MTANESLFGFDGVETPVLAGGEDRGALVVDLEVDRFGSHALDEDGVVAALLDGYSEAAPAVGVAPAAREGGLADRHPAACHDGPGACENACRETENIVRAEGIGA
ncbi:MAG: hypothetical protein NT061_12965 [Spirochaetes bacterium]|nr:hypothetical protein [Spirochaetota bacterium]